MTALFLILCPSSFLGNMRMWVVRLDSFISILTLTLTLAIVI